MSDGRCPYCSALQNSAGACSTMNCPGAYYSGLHTSPSIAHPNPVTPPMQIVDDKDAELSELRAWKAAALERGYPWSVAATTRIRELEAGLHAVLEVPRDVRPVMERLAREFDWKNRSDTQDSIAAALLAPAEGKESRDNAHYSYCPDCGGCVTANPGAEEPAAWCICTVPAFKPPAEAAPAKCDECGGSRWWQNPKYADNAQAGLERCPACTSRQP